MASPDLTAPDWDALPRPADIGLPARLTGRRLPDVTLDGTGGAVALGALDGLSVIYVYPMTGRPGVPLPDGWDAIPGARGCTPQSCAFRDHAGDLAALGVRHLFGLSSQGVGALAEAKARLHLPFDLLSDARLAFARALDLPTFEAGGATRIERVTLIARDGRIEHAVHPVFPPDRNAAEVIGWLEERR